ncbi:hypothetical protein L3V86_03750 [Thiotrichales bacterium 19S11-10]|nr:hypothetical protein [Thiotrichales bacterium 19S11-10]
MMLNKYRIISALWFAVTAYLCSVSICLSFPGSIDFDRLSVLLTISLIPACLGLIGGLIYGAAIFLYQDNKKNYFKSALVGGAIASFSLQGFITLLFLCLGLSFNDYFSSSGFIWIMVGLPVLLAGMISGFILCMLSRKLKS